MRIIDKIHGSVGFYNFGLDSFINVSSILFENIGSSQEVV